MKPKSTKSTKTVKKKTKACRPQATSQWQSLLNPDAHRFFPGVDQLRERLIYTLMEWARDPEHIDTGQFLTEYYIPPRTMNSWVNKYDDVRDAWEQAKLLMASHRRVGAMKRKLDPKSCFRDIYHYDPFENEVDERQARLSKYSEEKQGNVTINVIDSTPEIVNHTKENDAGN